MLQKKQVLLQINQQYRLYYYDNLLNLLSIGIDFDYMVTFKFVS
jgi:hypothetical protein